MTQPTSAPLPKNRSQEKNNQESSQTNTNTAPQTSAAFGTGDASFQAAGGFDGVKKLVDAFYAAMSTLPQAQTIRAMHADDLDESRDKLTRFLSGWLGGPKLFSEKYGSIRIPVAHRHLEIGSAERDAWLKCMEVAAEQQDYSAEFQEYLLKQLFVPAERSRNRD